MKIRNLPFIWNLWPPFLGMGIVVKEVSDNFRKVVMELKKRPWTANYFGTQYGGAIFAMSDGVHMLMLIKNLPKDYRIWDKSANIEYLKLGKTTLRAEFLITDADLSFIQKEVAEKGSLDWEATVDIYDMSGQVVARVIRILSIKPKTD